MHVAPTSGFWMSSAEFTARRKDKAGWLNSSLPTVEPAPFMLHDAANLYDAVYLFARAADALLRQGTALNYRGALLKELKNTTFVGLSGRVTLDPQGDRVEQLGIMNYLGLSNATMIGIWSDLAGFSRLPVQALVWPGGAAEIPSAEGVHRSAMNTRIKCLRVAVLCASSTCTLNAFVQIR